MIPVAAALLTLLSFFLLYNTSARADVPGNFVRSVAFRFRTATKAVAAVLLLAAFIIFSLHYGFGAGFFIAFTILCAIASVVILFGPLVQNRK